MEFWFHFNTFLKLNQASQFINKGLLEIAPLPLLNAESISAWSNQGSLMCLLSILNQ